jgi:hypothetical protein
LAYFSEPGVLIFLSAQETIFSALRTDGAVYAALWIWDFPKSPRVADVHIPGSTISIKAQNWVKGSA